MAWTLPSKFRCGAASCHLAFARLLQYKNVYMLAMTRKNANVTIALLFMYKIMEILKAYVGSVEVCPQPAGMAAANTLRPSHYIK